jgi:hypothetical protein
VYNQINKAVSNYGKQMPDEDIGIDAFEFWCPQRRPNGHNIAIKIEPGLNCFTAENVRNGIDRPTVQPNAWVADLSDPTPRLEFLWDKPKNIKSVILKFDTDFDHPMESVLMGHPERVMPFCVRDYKLYNDQGMVVFEKTGNYQTLNRIDFPLAVTTKKLVLEVKHPSGEVPASVFEVQCYE